MSKYIEGSKIRKYTCLTRRYIAKISINVFDQLFMLHVDFNIDTNLLLYGNDNLHLHSLKKALLIVSVHNFKFIDEYLRFK